MFSKFDIAEVVWYTLSQKAQGFTAFLHWEMGIQLTQAAFFDEFGETTHCTLRKLKGHVYHGKKSGDLPCFF